MPALPVIPAFDRFVRFAMVSGTGWVLDFGIFALALAAACGPLIANLIGASLAVTFVFIVSVRHIFRDDGRFLWSKFAAYALWQAIAVTLASWGVERLVVVAELSPMLSKIVITPVTLGANFVFMDLLTRRGRQRSAVAAAGQPGAADVH